MVQPDGRLTGDLVPEDRLPRDACGVFGVWSPGEDVAKLAYYGLYALQHRGQEAAGIAVSDGERIVVYKDMGLVPQVFNEGVLEPCKVTSRSATAATPPAARRCGRTLSRRFAQPPPAGSRSGTTEI